MFWSSPRAAFTGFRMPLGNGFESVADGVRKPSSVATYGVDWLNPGCWTPIVPYVS
jgi:hypothetical protein